MSSLAFVFLCIQACLLQNAFGQCPSVIAPSYGCSGLNSGLVGLNSGLVGLNSGILGLNNGLVGVNNGLVGIGGLGSSYGNAYGGTGSAVISASGDMGVSGQTYVSGIVPVAGIVGYNGQLPALGTVSIAGSCGCGCVC